jgi:hypothetical protein
MKTETLKKLVDRIEILEAKQKECCVHKWQYTLEPFEDDSTRVRRKCLKCEKTECGNNKLYWSNALYSVCFNTCNGLVVPNRKHLKKLAKLFAN